MIGHFFLQYVLQGNKVTQAAPSVLEGDFETKGLGKKVHLGGHKKYHMLYN